jgi:hypothetical protein
VLPAPRAKFREQVWQHELLADAQGWTSAALVNDRLGLGFEVSTRKHQLPCFYQWQNCQSGLYAMGLEPSTHHVLGDQAARDRGEMIWLSHAESRSYDAVFSVLDGAEAIAAADDRIASVARQPEHDFPQPSGRFRALAGSGAGAGESER